MRLIGKYLCKNIFLKPLRTVLLLFCIASFGFVSILSLDLTGELKPLTRNMLTQITGSSDIILSSAIGPKETYDIKTETRQLLLFEAQNSFVKVEEDFYTYYHRDTYSIMNCDYNLAYEMRLLNQPITLEDDEIAVTFLFARKYGYSVGDRVEICDESGTYHSYKVVEILEQKGLSNGRVGVFVNEHLFSALSSVRRASSVYVDVVDDALIAQAAEELEMLDYNINLQVLNEDSSLQEMIQTVASLFVIIFAVCFLLVIFVTISVSGRIIQERMSVVGTFRSFGCSPVFVTGLLIGENILYGFLGGSAGILLYKMCRTTLFQSIYSVSTAGGIEVNMDIGILNPAFIVITLVFVVLVECLCPLKEILKASKMSIRDIIFDNKDMVYRLKRFGGVFGCVCLLVAGLLMVTKWNLFAMIVSFVFFILAVALLYPWVLKGVTHLLLRLLENANPLLKFAVRECIARKSTVGSGVLCVTASGLAIIIFVFVMSIQAIYEIDTYAADVIVTLGYQQGEAPFAYIKDLEGVREVETIYSSNNEVLINGSKKNTCVFGFPENGFSLLTGIKELPKEVEDEQVYMDRRLCEQLGIQVGENVEIVFNTETFLPTTQNLQLAGYIDSYDYDTVACSILLSQKTYIDIYHNFPSQILVKCADATATKNQIEKYSSTKIDSVQTLSEYHEEWKLKGQQLKNMLMLIIFLGVGLTITGMVSNQLIGFQGRKRECAVLLSTAMNRQKLSGMLLLETLISSGIALFVALPAALLAVYPLRGALWFLAGDFPIVIDVRLCVMFLLALCVIFSAVAFFPIRELRKMKIAIQLKYE